MANAITGIDHVLIGVGDLEAAAATWRRMGFTTTPRGAHVGRRTGNYCIMFARDYVELIGIVTTEAPPSSLETLLAERGDGLIGAAMATEGAHESYRLMREAGLDPAPVADLARPVDLPNGPGAARFALVELPPERTPDFRLFVCDHLTPEAVRQPAWLKHANGVTGIRTIAAVVAEPVRLEAAHAALFGPGATTMTDNTLTVFTGSARLVFATEEDMAALYPDIDLPSGGPVPRGAAVSFAVADIEATAAYLDGAGVAYEAGLDGALQIAPAFANGTLVEFAPAD